MMEATIGAYFLPTIGLNCFEICLLALLRYDFEVVEITSRSGISVSWNLVGRSLNSEMRSSSSSCSCSSFCTKVKGGFVDFVDFDDKVDVFEFEGFSGI
ncbi:hypothetical protein HanXRQr2_Chr15g0705081 [Helianthus annuus]|uniref:Uncharacterized protein n=1 Tax=Helianthus annuus TaxID=4232 RepID=A0A9K3E235_HELAN|nr:hypothetical protein HanXRQr2_Chr15g0705081 [Helianthus annuus]KAJ0456822.1 hypothetical protein HanIR_Chr15g0766771 [Helianthus annuus]KAJ0473966.1 hypothetical protein HanHA89_Chr15g0624321 [Helianthus annuus]KAJ0649539.1 hypothetical protein HanLR1_Chr15g0585401 [Helianthus annuus]KAJ0653334.1 hypothetical protein HanOQP8_Chr15g0582311 [Helianthus annuus]